MGGLSRHVTDSFSCTVTLLFNSSRAPLSLVSHLQAEFTSSCVQRVEDGSFAIMVEKSLRTACERLKTDSVKKGFGGEVTAGFGDGGAVAARDKEGLAAEAEL